MTKGNRGGVHRTAHETAVNAKRGEGWGGEQEGQPTCAQLQGDKRKTPGDDNEGEGGKRRREGDQDIGRERARCEVKTASRLVSESTRVQYGELDCSAVRVFHGEVHRADRCSHHLLVFFE